MIKKCIVCEKEMNAYQLHKGGRGARMKPRRRANSITCSPKCSKTYARIYDRVQTKLSNHLKGKCLAQSPCKKRNLGQAHNRLLD